MNDDRRREVADAALEALRHTVERDEHMPVLKRLVERREGMEARLEGWAWMGSPPGMAERSAAVGTSLRLPSLISPRAKRVELLHQLAPKITRIALLMNPDNRAASAEQADAEAVLGLRKRHETKVACASGTLLPAAQIRRGHRRPPWQLFAPCALPYSPRRASYR